MAVPGIMYGLETTVWSRNVLDIMEVVQNKAGTKVLGANRYVAVKGIKGDFLPE